MSLLPGRIRDPVHGYLTFTAIERALLDHPATQRLRHVSQSAAAHLVFPEMRVSRLAHSLGAMHLASRFLAACLRNAPADINAEVLEATSALIRDVAPLGVPPEAKALLSDQQLLAAEGVPDDARFGIRVVEQGLRLGALVHDLGHLPFSHDFEDALDVAFRSSERFAEQHGRIGEQSPEGKRVHERVGYRLSDHVEAEVFVHGGLGDSPIAKPAEMALLVARRILHVQTPYELADPSAVDRLLAWLHSLIAGEVDLDRCDYVLRDVRHYGLIAADYDLDRLVDNLVVVRAPTGSYETAVLPQGVSAAESFFVARLRMYQWGVYHHKVQQAAAGLRISIQQLLLDPRAREDEIRVFLTDLAAIVAGTADSAVVKRFADYDDVWWFGLMRDSLNTGLPADLEPWVALFVRRRPGPESLWKRPTDFPQSLREFNGRLPRDQDVELRQAWDEVVADLRQRGVVVVRLGFSPWRKATDNRAPGSAVSVWLPQTKELSSLTTFSPLVHALADAWASESKLSHSLIVRSEEPPQRLYGNSSHVYEHRRNYDDSRVPVHAGSAL